jgi:acetyltransferase-like isoleucine patch superfamily enzyme
MIKIRDIFLYIKYKRKKFKLIGKNVDYKQLHSKFLHSYNISLHDNTKILDYAYFDGVGGITIRQCTIIAPLCTIITSNHNYDENKISMLPFNNELITKPVKIEEFCWIGRNVMIMPGVTIGKGSVIAAGSIVTKDVEPFSVVGGNPARLIRKRNPERIKQLIANNMCINSQNLTLEKKYIK